MMEAQRSTLETKSTYEQLCQSLLDVQHAADTVFDTITKRVSTEHGRLNNLTSRIRLAKVSIKPVIFSFLGQNHCNIRHKSGDNYSFKCKISICSCGRVRFYANFSWALESEAVYESWRIAGMIFVFPLQYLDAEEGTIELFRFFSETSHEYMLDVLKEKAGIEGVSSVVKSVADMLLFNSTELPYSKYRLVDNLEDAGQPTKENECSSNIIVLPPPPQSILQSGTQSTSGVEEYGFRPVLRQVPSFSLPSSLPHLSMVAEINWKGSEYRDDNLSSIAPSAVYSGSSAYPLKLASGDADKSEITSRKGSEESFPCDDLKNKGSEPPPLPPPPPPPPPPPLPPPLHRPFLNVNSEVEATSSSNTRERVTLVAKEAFPAGGSTILGNNSTKIPHAGSPPPQLDSQHSALMASIRSPGIALRKTGTTSSKPFETLASPLEQNQDVKGKEQQTAPPRKQPIDILAEMATTLKMRRLSMQGAAYDKDKDKSDREDTSKLVPESEEDAMDVVTDKQRKLPPPMANLKAYMAQAKDVSSDDEEWDD
ncbi:hypothetical protein O6H91_09G113900 [Diphasiastrum complanatum]|uniref:Uncharacterized protein n=1 Tax=Diphasiastrum complanatum TaxID=34168 RepID=A0ACC2CUF9_DIPCM|nr:hypothetical protein O6H91_09G113900 [Diphasiastrum complanatum]